MLRTRKPTVAIVAILLLYLIAGKPNLWAQVKPSVTPPEVDAALCEIVYPVDRPPLPADKRYLFFGNGFFIDDKGHLLTAAHVVSDLDGGQPYVLIRPTSEPPKIVEANVIAIDHDHDVALLLAKSNPFEGGYHVSFLPIAAGSVQLGEDVLAATLRPIDNGNPANSTSVIENLFSAVRDFEFSRFEDAQAETELFLFDQSILPGQSGAPVISTHTGAVIGLMEGEWVRAALAGVASARHTGANGRVEASNFIFAGEHSQLPGVAIPIHYALSLLRKNALEWQLPQNELAKTKPNGDCEDRSVPVPFSLVPASFPSDSFFGGEVLIDALVTQFGTVSDVRIVHGEDPFLRKALDAIHTWMFLPGCSEGHPSEGHIFVSFEFPQPYVPPRSAIEHDYDDTTSISHGNTGLVPVHTVEPTYPDKSGRGGSVILYGSVDAAGQLTTTQVLLGSEPLRVATIAALRRWKFASVEAEGRTIDSSAIVAVTFRQPPLVIGRSR